MAEAAKSACSLRRINGEQERLSTWREDRVRTLRFGYHHVGNAHLVGALVAVPDFDGRLALAADDRLVGGAVVPLASDGHLVVGLERHGGGQLIDPLPMKVPAAGDVDQTLVRAVDMVHLGMERFTELVHVRKYCLQLPRRHLA